MRTIVAVASIVAASAALAADGVRTGRAAYGDWRSDAPGVERLITPADLPPPYATPSAANPSSRVARPPGALPKAPSGFSVDLFASGLSVPRVIRAAPNGDLFVAESGAGRVLVFRSDGAKRVPRSAARLRGRPAAALWDRLLSARPRPALGLCRDRGRGAAFRLSKRRPRGLAPAEVIVRRSAFRRRALDARPCFLAGRQDAVRLGRLGDQRC